jgi:hypothetical protein
MALDNCLIDCPTGLVTGVSDPFLLSSLRRAAQPSSAGKWLLRLLDLCFRRREEFQVLSKHLSMKR